jgi:hypothetical protein
MLLDLIWIIFSYVGIMFSIVLPIVVEGTDFDFLPWPWIGVIFFICGIGIVRWRGSTTTAWLVMDFPSPNSKNGLTLEGPRIYLQKLFPSVAEYMKNKKDWYYHENTEGAYSFGGHDTRMIDSEVGYCFDTTKARFVNEVEKDFYDYAQMVEEVKKIMVSTKTKDDKFLLTGTDKPLRIENVDIEKDKFHKEVFETISDGYFIKVHGKVFSLKSFKRFQDKQAAPYQIGSIIHYVKALAAMKAAGVKKGMGHLGMYIAIIVVVIIVIAVLALLMTGTIKMPSGFSL